MLIKNMEMNKTEHIHSQQMLQTTVLEIAHLGHPVAHLVKQARHAQRLCIATAVMGLILIFSLLLHVTPPLFPLSCSPCPI